MVCIHHQYSVHNAIMSVYVVVAMKYLCLAMVDSFTLQMENDKYTVVFQLSETDGRMRTVRYSNITNFYKIVHMPASKQVLPSHAHMLLD